MSTLRSLVRMILELKEDKDDDKKKSHLILEPDASKKRKPRSKRQEASTVSGSMTSSGMLAEPDGSGIDSGDGCEDVGDCKKDNEKEEKRMKKPTKIKREASVAASAGGGPAMPLGVGPHYPGPDSPAVKRIKKQIDVVGRAYGGAKTTKKKSH